MYPIWKALRGPCIWVSPAQVFTGIGVIYGTRMSKKEGCDDGRETGEFLRAYSRVEYLQKEGKKLPWCLRHE